MMKHRVVVIGVDGGIPTAVERYAREGALPQVARLMERGTFAEACLPAMPTITPTCWATIATGATSGVHGCTCATLHQDGDPFDKTTSAYWSERVQAELVWEAAERAGRAALVVAYPTSWPPRLRRGYQIGGPGCGVVEYHTPETSPGRFLVGGAELQFFTAQEVKHELATRISLSRDSGGRLSAVLPAQTRHSVWRLAPFGWRAHFEAENRVRFTDLRDGAPVAELAAGQWSQDRTLRLTDGATERRVTYRIKLVDASESGQRLTAFVTPMADLTSRASPPGLGRELNALGGVPPYWHHGTLMQKRIISHETFLEIERLNFAWRTLATRHIHSRDPLDLVFHYSVMMDTINHAHRCLIEGYGQADEATRRESADLERRAYGLVDGFVGEMQEIFGSEAVILLVSDHGSCGYSRAFQIKETLKNAGLLVMETGPDGKEGINWRASRAVPLHSSYVAVNLAGRDPTGIVPPEDYERTVDEIIAALYDARDPDTGKRMIALALRREDARLVGLGGPLTPDVVFAVAGGIGSPGGGVHAGQIPTARSRAGTQCSLLLAAGPGVRKGCRITRTVRQHDIAPTLSRLLGIPPPRHAEGAPIREMLDE